jgi:hypothetical protein
MEAGNGLSEIHFVVPKGLPLGPHNLIVSNAVGEDEDSFNIE